MIQATTGAPPCLLSTLAHQNELETGVGVVGESSFLYTTGWFIQAQAEGISFTWLLVVTVGICYYVSMHYVLTNRNWFITGG